MGDELAAASFDFAATARAAGLRASVYLGSSGKLGRQLRWASDQGARWCLIYGRAEADAGTVTVRDLRSGEQERGANRRPRRLSLGTRGRGAGPPMTTGNFIDQDAWFAQLPGAVVSAGALITDPAGQVLLVKPNYRDHWTLPGGICEHGEPPHVGCSREVAEEIGLDLPIGALLAIDWSQPYGRQARPIMHFVFDGGTIDNGDGDRAAGRGA